MNADTLDLDTDAVFLSGASSVQGEDGDKSACLTPVSFGMDLSMVANKGSMTLSIDGFEDEDEATLSAATTPSLPVEDYKLETCYCCPIHAEQPQPPEVKIEECLFEPLQIPDTKITRCLPESQAGTPPLMKQKEFTSEVSKKKLSLFEGGGDERGKEMSTLHASINFSVASSQQLRQDARLRKFETITQSTSNSNFPFESNTLKRVPNNANEFIDVTHTQSCINLKSSVCASPASSASSSPQRKTGLNQQQQSAALHRDALLVKEKFIEPPKRIDRGFQSKTQSMDADFLFNEFLLVPAHTPMQLPPSSDSNTSSASTSPTLRTNRRFIATKVIDDLSTLSSN